MKVSIEVYRVPVLRKQNLEYFCKKFIPGPDRATDLEHVYLYDVSTNRFVNDNINEYNTASAYGGAVIMTAYTNIAHYQGISNCSMSEEFDLKRGKRNAFRKLMEAVLGEEITFEYER